MKFQATLKKLAADFRINESEGGSNANVSSASAETGNIADEEAAVLNKLDRSVKFDELDTITFGLETDDGKIVKVYVNAEQAEAFEKALAEKLGEVDDIEEVLNALSKEYEIVDVEWPEDGEATSDIDAPEDLESDGSEVLDQKVYGQKKKEEDQFEGLTMGEELTMSLMESSTSLESRFTTASQLMVYHAILDLGIPEVALARNPYRAAIVKGIKDTALDVQKSASLKIALKTFIRRAVDFDKKAAENDADEKRDVKEEMMTEAYQNNVIAALKKAFKGKYSDFKIEDYVSYVIAGGNSLKKEHPDFGLVDAAIEIIEGGLKNWQGLKESMSSKQELKDLSASQLEQLIKKLRKEYSECDDFVTARHDIEANINRAIQFLNKTKEVHKRVAFSGSQSKQSLQGIGNKGVNEEMKIIKEEKVDWSFSSDKENLTISCKSLNFELGSEETEKMIKGINNRDAVVVRDNTESPPKKIIFSPRGSTILVKQIGSQEGYMMTSKDIDDLIGAATPKTREKVKDEEEFA